MPVKLALNKKKYHQKVQSGKLTLFILAFVLIGITSSSFAQSDTKIDKVLEKHVQKHNYQKCEKAAQKFRKKQPKSKVPYYYLAQITMHEYYAIEPAPDKKQWRHLKNAANHTRRLDGAYPDWENSVKNEYINYIKSWNDTSFSSTHVRSVVKSYPRFFGDTLDVYFYYFQKKEQQAPDFEETAFTIPQTDSLRTALLSYASLWVGVPYKWAGEDPKIGFDCSGFVLYVYKHIGIELPHSAQMQSELQGEVLTLDEAKPGDLIFFGRQNGEKWHTQHAGIYYGNENGEPKVIHCVTGGVSIDGDNSSWDHYWKDLILFVKRLPELE